MIKYLKIGSYFLKEVRYYGYLLVLDNIHLLLLIFVLTSLAIFGAKHQGIDTVGGIPLTSYVWYVFITELVMVNRKDQHLIDEIKGGSIITFLNKPISFIGFYFAQTFFKTLITMLIVGSFCAGVILLFTQQFPFFGIMELLLFLLSFLIGIAMLTLVSLIIALAAFLLEDSTFIRLMINKLYFIFGGLFFPLDLYPQRMKSIAQFLPFQYYLYAPAKFFSGGELGFFWSYFPLQVLWLGILTGIVLAMGKTCMRRLEINGG
ncbi:MAG: hypothetical protein DLD55_00775 [candidate division SR1 bacterium]|nr:MAG: hypothetical protein DLD55_00775 [candidate division SR1 bacterium]